MSLILASGSAIRRQVLEAAGVPVIVEKPRVDEEAVKASLRAENVKPRDQADALAEVKALSVSNLRMGFVLGADQMLALDDDVFDKPADRDAARAQLQRLRGKTHMLLCAAVIAKDGAVIWRHIETPRLRMRNFTDAFLDDYLDQVGEAAYASVGGYQLEGLGAQLFDRIDGDYFSVLGLPLLPLLSFLREHGVVGK
ncbi:MAG: Maf family protein [Caulobacterales bacterium]